MQFTDSHCHLDFPELSTNLPELLNSCLKQKIKRIVIPSIAPSNWYTVHKLSQQSSAQLQLLAAVGIHPWYLTDLNHEVLDDLAHFVKQHHSTLAAIGEAGIDGKIAEQEDNWDKQIQFFEAQLSLAKQFDLPIIVHHRKSHQHIVPMLKKAELNRGGIIHGFSGSYQQASHYIDLGFKLGIGGTISYERAQKTINTVKKLPLTSIVLETDAPAMPLSGFQGEPNSPLKLNNVFEILTSLRGEPAEMIAEQIEKNINNLFMPT